MLGAVNMVTDTINVALYDVNHAFTATDTTYTTTNELPTAGGYTLGGKPLLNKAVDIGVTAANTATFDNTDDADTTWTSATFTTYHAVIYDITNTNSLIASIDYGEQTVTGGTFTIQWNANGIISLI
jgi:hypothetical protein